MLENTHDLVDGDNVTKLSACNCSKCNNRWWVRCQNEFQPSYCPYCGLKFKWYTKDNKNFEISGQQINDK